MSLANPLWGASQDPWRAPQARLLRVQPLIVGTTISGDWPLEGSDYPGRETRAYVAYVFSNNASVIDTATNTVGVGLNPIGVAVTPDGNAPMSRPVMVTLTLCR